MNSHQTRQREAAFYSEEKEKWEERGGGTEPRGAVVSITRTLGPRLDAQQRRAAPETISDSRLPARAPAKRMAARCVFSVRPRSQKLSRLTSNERIESNSAQQERLHV